MSDASLAARLAALAEEQPQFENGARRIDGPDAFDAILAEIDHTVLPARLTFSAGGASLALIVAGRRLCAVPDVADVLSPDDLTAIEAAAAAIAAFSEGVDGPLLVAEGEAAEGAGDPTQRVSVNALAQAAGRVAIDPDLPLPERVQARLGAVAQAHVVMSGQTVNTSDGPSELVSMLTATAQEKLAAFVAQRRESCPSHKDPSMTIMAGAAGDGRAIGLVTTGEEHLLFVVPESGINEALRVFKLSI